MGTLSKAMGSYGGYVCASSQVIEYLKSTARSLIFTTALPPATIASSIAALDVIKSRPEITMTPIKNASLFCRELGMDKPQSQIVAVIVGDNNKALNLSSQLQDKGFLVTAIRPPTVPYNTARLRFTFCSEHTKEDIISVARLLRGLL
jgi:8-amino-7-oxononanoate synthase